MRPADHRNDQRGASGSYIQISRPAMSGPNYHQGVSRVQEAASILRISCSVRFFTIQTFMPQHTNNILIIDFCSCSECVGPQYQARKKRCKRGVTRMIKSAISLENTGFFRMLTASCRGNKKFRARLPA